MYVSNAYNFEQPDNYLKILLRMHLVVHYKYTKITDVKLKSWCQKKTD